MLPEEVSGQLYFSIISLSTSTIRVVDTDFPGDQQEIAAAFVWCRANKRVIAGLKSVVGNEPILCRDALAAFAT